MVVSRRILIRVAIAAVVFFLIAFPTSDTHQGFLDAVSDVTWICGVLSLLLLIVLGVVALVQSRRPGAR